MASRRKSLNDFNPLDRQEGEKPTLENVTEGIFGSGQSGVPVRETIKLIAIDQIQPDPAQPRRVVPSMIRAIGFKNMDELFQHWMVQANLENAARKYPELKWEALFDTDTELDIEDEKHKTRDYGPIAATLIRVALLARSIKKDGLINPITVARIGRDYLIETGERRWWAYNLLALFLEEYKKIPAREVEKRDIWRQAVENLSREELSAIGRARQFAILLMDLYRQEGFEFQPYEALVKEGCDRAYYAQVADGSKFKIPAGKADLICGAMNITSPEYLRQIRATLRVEDDLWVEADDNNYSWAWILDADRLRRQREKEDKTRPVPDLGQESRAVRHLTVSDEDADAATQEIEVLTLDGSRWSAPLGKYEPTDYSVVGKYQLSANEHNYVRIALCDGLLIFAPPLQEWAALTAYDVGLRGLEDAVRRYRTGDLGENAKDESGQPSGGRENDVLTMTGTVQVGLQADWDPTSYPWGVYPTHETQTEKSLSVNQINVGLHEHVLIWRYYNQMFPRQTGKWMPIKLHLLQDKWISTAVERFRQGDLGWQSAVDTPAGPGVADKPAQPIGDDALRQSWGMERDEWAMLKAMKPGEVKKAPYYGVGYHVCLKTAPDTRQEVKAMRWSPRRETWLYKLDDNQVIEESELLRYRRPSESGNAQPQNKDGVFLPGSGWVPNTSSSQRSTIPKSEFDLEPGDSYTLETGWVQGGKKNAGDRVVIKGGQEATIKTPYYKMSGTEWTHLLEDGTAVRNSLIERVIPDVAAPDTDGENKIADRSTSPAVPAVTPEPANLVKRPLDIDNALSDEEFMRRQDEEYMLLEGVSYNALEQWTWHEGRLRHVDTGQVWNRNLVPDWQFILGHVHVHATRATRQLQNLLIPKDADVSLLAAGKPDDLARLQEGLYDLIAHLGMAQNFASRLSDWIDELQGRDAGE